MPRKSAEAIAGEAWRRMQAPPHPEPPVWLSEAAARHWREIVVTRPVDYFDAPNQHLLEALCVHIATADVVWSELAKIDVADPAQMRRYRTLLTMANRQSQMISMLLTKLRLLPSRLGTMPQMARPARPPWEQHV
jgi:phage terminase small subunit